MPGTSSAWGLLLSNPAIKIICELLKIILTYSDAMKERGLRSSWDSAAGWVDTCGAHVRSTKEAPVSESYSGRQFVGIDLHRRRSVIVRMTTDGDQLECIRISNDVERLSTVMARAGEAPEVVLEATYGWYWAVDAL